VWKYVIIIIMKILMINDIININIININNNNEIILILMLMCVYNNINEIIMK